MAIILPLDGRVMGSSPDILILFINLNMKIFWKEIIDPNAIMQLENCMIEWSIWVLTADAHYWYSMPVWGAIAYKNHISLSWVWFDIWCGNKAVKTDIKLSDIDLTKVFDEIIKVISFWVWRKNPDPIKHEVLDKIKNAEYVPLRSLYDLARNQLGTIWSWNHYVDIFVDEDDYIRVWVHFWSRWFWHKITTWFISLSQWLSFTDKGKEWTMDSKPILFDLESQIGKDYLYSMRLAWEYAYAGRNWVCDTVVNILWWKVIDEIHNHHNFAREEEHFWEKYYVVRKWCTPAFPWQRWFIWSNMKDYSVIVEWVDSEDSKLWLYSTVHWAGRVMWRRKAIDTIDFQNTKQVMKDQDILLYWAWPDESWECYKSLEEVLSYQWDTIKIIHKLKPLVVMMAWANEIDPYKD